jgi:hypothetical protein
MPVIPAFLLKQLYVKGSLEVVDGNTHFKLRNNLASATIDGLSLAIDGNQVAPQTICVTIRGAETPLTDVSPERPLHFPFDAEALCEVRGLELAKGKHLLSISPQTREIGSVTIDVEDEVV